MIALVVAHCGANWKYCDGGSVAGGLFFLWLIRRSVKRAERKARQRALDRIAAREQARDQASGDDPPLL